MYIYIISGNKKEHPHAYIPHTRIQDMQQKTHNVMVVCMAVVMYHKIYICKTNTAREGGGEGSEDVAQREKYRETYPRRTHSSPPATPPTHHYTHMHLCQQRCGLEGRSGPRQRPHTGRS